MKKWLAFTCPVCGFRYPRKKFSPKMRPILYIAQIVTGGGRAKGFTTLKYLPWQTLPALRETDAWYNLLCLYDRLGAAFDNFYQVLGFLSPGMKTLIQKLQNSYASAYQTGPVPEYAHEYPTTSFGDIAESYDSDIDPYPKAYAHLLINPIVGGLLNE